MTMTDPISDLLTRIRNALMAGHKSLTIKHSKIKEAILKILEQEGYITSWSRESASPQDILDIVLKYNQDGQAAIHGLSRRSKPGRRVYVGAGEVPHVRAGLGVAIVSTSRGVLADHHARKENIGGELLCTVW